MTELSVRAERLVGAPAELAYRCIADYRTHHPRFLPPAFSDFHVEQGGVGAGTVHSFQLTAGGRTRTYRMRVEEPEPGRVLTESDTGSSLVTTWTVTPEGRDCRVRIETGAAGPLRSDGAARVSRHRGLRPITNGQSDRSGRAPEQ